MDTTTAIRARRNVRTYDDRPISRADLDAILGSARRTPSSMNQQAWDQCPSCMLAATDLGVGSSHAAVSEQAEARRLLRVPENHEVAWLVELGYPEDRPLEPLEHVARRPFERRGAPASGGEIPQR